MCFLARRRGADLMHPYSRSRKVTVPDNGVVYVHQATWSGLSSSRIRVSIQGHEDMGSHGKQENPPRRHIRTHHPGCRDRSEDTIRRFCIEGVLRGVLSEAGPRGHVVRGRASHLRTMVERDILWPSTRAPDIVLKVLMVPGRITYKNSQH